MSSLTSRSATMPAKRTAAAVVLAAFLALFTAGSPAQALDSPTADGTAAAAEADDLLATLPIKGRAPKTGYERSLFGPTWADVDGNGCDTRNDILRRDLTDITYTNSVPCKVQSGMLADPYTGTSISFVRGTATSSAVQIDHVVALSDAWQKGAQQLTTEQRTAFANDPLNLQATDGPTNQQKGDGDAATWLPPSKGFRCEYVARQVSVKARYSLWVTQAEHDAIAGILAGCPGQLAPAAVEPAATAAVYYANCSEVIAAGAAPLYAGSEGYRAGLDGDSDGVACEG
ncbi:putative calcium-binding protein [Pseudarthrobacter phenanthrenivorans Sphe3]|uniref:Putative calcium-binding protein n=2 Tax=Pseudarthrobacter phenanthrenivorans TaxID=361575 RepID=F0M2Z9_PSEPM|nr:putative calcium-binding protein [Pseudarthrobacter phenanthrenivorans Sphe3]